MGAGGSAVSFNAQAIALQIAIILIGLPLYLAHWLWAERLVARNSAESGAVLRQLYLLGMMAGFLGPAVANAYSLLDSALRPLLGVERNSFAFPDLEPGSATIYCGVALAVLTLLWVYHRRIVAGETQTGSQLEAGALTLRRLYRYGFSAAGLTMALAGSISLLHWLLFQIGVEAIAGSPGAIRLVGALAGVLIGLPLWLLPWRRIQTLAADPVTGQTERLSQIRKTYLYFYLFVATMTLLTGAVFIVYQLVSLALGARTSLI